jgi:hypothetical protein
MELRKPHHVSAVEVIRLLAGQRGTDFEVSIHAIEEMNKDSIDLLDIRNSLLNASEAIEQDANGLVQYRVKGKDSDGRVICSVIEIEETPPGIFVITVWEVGKR